MDGGLFKTVLLVNRKLHLPITNGVILLLFWLGETCGANKTDPKKEERGKAFLKIDKFLRHCTGQEEYLSYTVPGKEEIKCPG